MNINIDKLYEKDTSEIYKYLQELERLSDESSLLYPYIDKLMEMVSDERYVVRVRGFRLVCKQAKWDKDNKINDHFKEILDILHDEKPTAVRQALAALKDIVLYKSELHEELKEQLSNINYMGYRDTMQGLILKDINQLLVLMNQE